MFILTFRRLLLLAIIERLGYSDNGGLRMYCVVFVDCEGKTGEFRAGANRQQARVVVDKVLCLKGQQPSLKVEEAARQFGLKPIVWYKLVKRSGKFSEVGMVVPEPVREEPVREEPVRLVRRRKLPEDPALLAANA